MAVLGIKAMRDLGMLDHVQSNEPEYVLPCVGPIGDIRPILEAELNGMTTTMLFASGSGSNCIAEDQVKLILPTYLNILRPSRAALYWNISGENIGEVDLDLKVGNENITAAFCVVRNCQVAMPLSNTSGHFLIGGNRLSSQGTSGHLLIGGEGLLTKLGMVMGPGKREMTIIPKKPFMVLPVGKVREAVVKRNWIEMDVAGKDEVYGLLKFQKENGKCKIEIHCSTGAVQTRMDHPSEGRNQANRSVRTMPELITVLEKEFGPAKTSEQTLDVEKARVAASARNWIEMEVKKKLKNSGLLRFSKEEGKWQINIYCSTGVVQMKSEIKHEKHEKHGGTHRQKYGGTHQHLGGSEKTYQQGLEYLNTRTVILVDLPR